MVIIKLPLEQVSTLKRATQGVRLMNLKDEQKVSTVALVEKEKESDENSDIINENAALSVSENIVSIQDSDSQSESESDNEDSIENDSEDDI